MCNTSLMTIDDKSKLSVLCHDAYVTAPEILLTCKPNFAYAYALHDFSTGKNLNIFRSLIYFMLILVCYPELLEYRYQCSLWFHCILAVPQVHPTSIYNLPLTGVTTRKAGPWWHIPSVGQTVMHVQREPGSSRNQTVSVVFTACRPCESWEWSNSGKSRFLINVSLQIWTGNSCPWAILKTLYLLTSRM